jgi:hypothetical protein
MLVFLNRIIVYYRGRMNQILLYWISRVFDEPAPPPPPILWLRSEPESEGGQPALTGLLADLGVAARK